ncbi:hypothetical protein R1Z03_24860 [Acidovorax sp. BLS4]|nr:hypothetical protein [Paracidovorax avenae]WOI45626.1 hypothetical protein R1Z03_24860 [Paracidovorax avenae]
MRDVHQANTHGGDKRPALPHKVQALHGVAQAFGDFFRHRRRAVLQQDAELVAPQPGQGAFLLDNASNVNDFPASDTVVLSPDHLKVGILYLLGYFVVLLV